MYLLRATIQSTTEDFRRAVEQIRFIFQKDHSGYYMEKGFEGVRPGTWRPVGVWVKEASDFEENDPKIGNTPKIVGCEGEKREGRS